MLKRYTIEITCAIIGWLIRFIYCLKYPVPVRDAYEYNEVINKWINTGQFPDDTFFPPLGLYIIKEAVLVGHLDVLKCGVLVNILLGILTIVILIKILEVLNLKIKVIWVIGILIATHPALVDYSCQLTREASFMFFSSLSVYGIICNLKKWEIYKTALVSIAITLAFLCRYEGMELMLILLGLIMAKSKKRIIEYIVVSVSCFVVLVIIERITGVSILNEKRIIDELYLDMNIFPH